MDCRTSEVFSNLCESLEGLIKVYRTLLQTVRKEKEILVSANIEELSENNKSKDAILIKVKSLEAQRALYSSELAVLLNMSVEDPKLSEFARQLDGEPGKKLHNLHSVLQLLLKRVREFNQENEVLVQSALASITGAMEAVRSTLQDKTTYQNKGKIDEKPALSGQFVSREA